MLPDNGDGAEKRVDYTRNKGGKFLGTRHTIEVDATQLLLNRFERDFETMYVARWMTRDVVMKCV